jgi:AraC-like DNA-binding protein
MPNTSLPIAAELMTLHYLTNLNVHALHFNGHSVMNHTPHILPPFLVPVQEKAFRELAAKLGEVEDACLVYTTEAGLTYAAGAYERSTYQDGAFEQSAYEDGGDEDGMPALFAFGPFLSKIPDMASTDPLSQRDRVAMKEFLSGLPLVKSSQLQSFLNVLHRIRTIRQVPVFYESEKSEDERQRQKVRTEMDSEPEYALIDLRYELNSRIVEGVKNGDKQAVQDILKESGNLYDFSERFPNQPVRAAKNSLIILNTTLRLAAESAGVPPFYLHHLSEKFAIKIERINSVEEFRKMLGTMSDEYCDLVKSQAISGYSLLVQTALGHLAVHYRNPLGLEELAEQLDVHPAHLSRQFKKEKGMTMTHYLNQTRVEKAKVLLLKDRSSIDWIAGAVGFADAAYFTRVFKKLAGTTPREYRNGGEKESSQE